MLSLYDYQLAMLHVMRDSAPIEAAALLHSLGATRVETALAEQRLRRAPRQRFDDYLAAWGAPDSAAVEILGVGTEWRKARWDLSFWPGLRIELTSPVEWFVGRRLVRHGDCPPPVLETVADLRPWSCTYDEFVDSGRWHVHYFDGMRSTRDIDAFVATDPESGRTCTYWARFDWSLLQSVELAPTEYVWKSCRDCDGSGP
ncbi:hypothetical protein [Nocardia sp. NPDC051833]|uniref:hypothetical protein n=1 Tax=Nocardia sp. NPDC051833 TaxID=3155674 RepID=UPI00344510EE